MYAVHFDFIFGAEDAIFVGFDICEFGSLLHHYGRTLDEFMNFCIDHPGQYYFYCLKLAGSHIMCWMNRNGYKYVDKKAENPFEWECLVTSADKWIYIDLVCPSGDKVSFYESENKIPLSPEEIAKPDAFNYPVGTPESEIIARAINQCLQEGRDKMTASSDAMAFYKQTVDFNKLFCPCWWNTHKSAETFCRKAYWGGINWVNPICEGEEENHGLVFDCNGLYYYVMREFPFPTGYPVRFYNKPPKGYPLFIAHVKLDIVLDRGKIPCMRRRDQNQWVNEFCGEAYVTSVDLENLVKYYTGTGEILDGYAWKGQTGIFTEYVDYWQKVKAESTGGRRYFAKQMLVRLYGKFGMKPTRQKKRPAFDYDGTLTFIPEKPQEASAYNIAIAAFVTAYGRRELLRAADQCKGIVAYVATDSVHIVSIPFEAARFDGDKDPKRLGAWKLERRVVRAKYVKSNVYIEEEPNGTLDVACAGLPESARSGVTFENFKLGASYKGAKKLVMKQNGATLEDCKFTIYDRPERF